MGWTKEVAVSSDRSSKSSKIYNQEFFKFLKRNGSCFGSCLWEQGKAEKVVKQVEVASKLLEGLSADIYTPSLRQLKEASQDCRLLPRVVALVVVIVVLP